VTMMSSFMTTLSHRILWMTVVVARPCPAMLGVQQVGTVGPASIASGEVPILARRTAIVNPLTRAHQIVPPIPSPLVSHRTNLDRQSLDSGASDRSAHPIAPLHRSHRTGPTDTGEFGVGSISFPSEEQP
jgi:hypothetical protein